MGAQERSTSLLPMLLLLLLADLPTSLGFEDENNCGLFEPEPQQSQMARVKVRRFFVAAAQFNTILLNFVTFCFKFEDRIVNGYKVQA